MANNFTIPIFAKVNTLSGIVNSRGDEFNNNLYNNPHFIEDILNNQMGLSKIVLEAFHKRVIMISNKEGYVWNANTTLWELKDLSYMYTMTTEFLSFYIRNQISKEHPQEYYIKLAKVLAKVQNYNYCEQVFKIVCPKLIDSKFQSKINTSSFELPIKDNQIINLKTLQVRYRTEKDYFDFELKTTFLRNNELTNAKRLFGDIMLNDDELVNYLQFILGYSITGETDLRSIFIFWGKGSNGKSVIFTFIKEILDKLCVSVDKKVFIKQDKQSSGHSAHLIPLIGARVAVYSESEEDDELNASQIKSLSGSDSISVRQIYGTQFEAKPVCKYLLLTNHKPKFDIRDQAMIDRIKYIPFNARFVHNPNPDLPNEKLIDTEFIDNLKNNHLDEIFTWLCIGAFNYYQTRKITVPDKIKEATQEYINSLDSVNSFISDCIIESNGNSVKKTLVFDKYEDYCSKNDIRKVATKTNVYDQMEAKGYVLKKNDGIYVYKNISIINLN